MRTPSNHHRFIDTAPSGFGNPIGLSRREEALASKKIVQLTNRRRRIVCRRQPIEVIIEQTDARASVLVGKSGFSASCQRTSWRQEVPERRILPACRSLEAKERDGNQPRNQAHHGHVPLYRHRPDNPYLSELAGLRALDPPSFFDCRRERPEQVRFGDRLDQVRVESGVCRAVAILLLSPAGQRDQLHAPASSVAGARCRATS